MNKEDAERIANELLKPPLLTVKLVNPYMVGGGLVDYLGVPYKIINKDGNTYTCQELTNQERAKIIENRQRQDKRCN